MPGTIRKIQLPNSETPISVVDDRVHIYRAVTGNPAITTGGTYNCTRWLVTDSTITAYEDGMICCLKVPISEDTIYGTGFQINSLGFKPVVWGANKPIKDRYEVNSVVWVTYNATQTAPIYINSATEMTSTGCWQIMDHGYELPDVTAVDNDKVLTVVNAQWTKKMPTVIYSGSVSPSASIGNEGDVYIQSSPVVIYETDGTTGLLGHNQSSFENQWQLENLDLTPYKYIKCYFKATTLTDSSKYTPAVIVTVPLDAAARGATSYFGGAMVPLPFNRNRYYLISCAVDGTKTKFQVVHQNTIWDVTTSDANSDGRYLYKIEGYF